MEPIEGFRLSDRVWFAATLAALALGFATLARQWHDAHNAVPKHGIDAAVRDHARGGTGETAVAEKEVNNR
jgi:hypothetical protein